MVSKFMKNNSSAAELKGFGVYILLLTDVLIMRYMMDTEVILLLNMPRDIYIKMFSLPAYHVSWCVCLVLFDEYLIEMY